MKIAHSIIVLASVIFVTGSMITVGMDLKATTDNVSTNVIEAKQKYNQDKEAQASFTRKYEEKISNETTDQSKTLYKKKLESLNQNTGRTKNRFLPAKRI